MRFTISKDMFLKGLQRTQSVVDKKNVIPVLSHVLIEADKSGVYMTATDLEVGVKGRYSAIVETSGRVAVPSRNLYEIVKELPNKEVSVEALKNYWIELRCGGAFFKIVGQDPDEFPNLPSFDKDSFFSIESVQILEMIDRTIASVSNDLTRYDLNGVYMEKVSRDDITFLRMVATDGHRLSLMDYEFKRGNDLNIPKGVIIPKKGLLEIKKLLDLDEKVQVGFIDNNIVITNEANSLVVVIRLINGEFPDYTQVIPVNNDKKVVIEREAFLNSLRRISVLSAEQARSVKLAISKNCLVISANNPNLGEAQEKLPVKYKGKEVAIGFNAGYFMDILQTMTKQQEVSLELSDNLSPCLIKGLHYDGNINIVMPMRLEADVEADAGSHVVEASDSEGGDEIDVAAMETPSPTIDTHAI